MVTDEFWEEIKQKYEHRCLCCGESEGEDLKLTKDHVIPLAKGGCDIPENIQPLCGNCNSSKGARVFDYRGPNTMFSGESQGSHWKTVKQAAKILGYTKRTIERKVRRGELPTYSSPSGRRFVWVTEFQQRESDLAISLEKMTLAIEEIKEGQRAIIEAMGLEATDEV